MEKTITRKPRILPLLLALLALLAVFALNVWRSRNGLTGTLAVCTVFGAAVLLALLLWRVYAILFRQKAALSRAFVPAALFLGLLFGLAFPLGSVPDEERHANMIYLFANRILGVEDTPAETQYSNVYEVVDSKMRQEDAAERRLLTADPSLTAYRAVLDNASFWYDEQQSAVTETQLTDLNVSPLLYAPAILGMLLGRTVHLGYYPLLLFCRLWMLLFYVFLTTWALRKMPFGRVALFLCALLPMSLHLSCSLSYDAVVLPLSFALLASVLDMAYGPHTRVTWGQVVRTAILAALIAQGKVGAYLPLLFLVLLIPRERFQRKGHRVLLFFGLLLVGALACVLSNLSVVVNAMSDGLRMDLSGIGGTKHTLSYLLSQPLRVLRLLVRTIVRNGFSYAATGLGMQLGWLNVPVSRVVIAGFAVLLFASCLHPHGEPLPDISGGQRLMFCVPFAVTTLALLIGMLLWWTPVGSVTVLGIQGRYFLPVLPCLLLTLPRVTYAGVMHLTHRTAVPLGAHPDRVIAFLGVFLSVCAIAGLYPMIFEQ